MILLNRTGDTGRHRRLARGPGGWGRRIIFLRVPSNPYRWYQATS